MPPKIWIWLVLVPALTRSHAVEFDGINEAVGVNQTLEEGFGARQSGMAVTFSPFQRDADAVANSPAAMNDVDDFTFSTGHAEKFGEAKFDYFSFLFPFESSSTLGLGVSRYGVSDIELRPEGSNPLESQPAELFSIADYLLVGAFARRWGGFDLGLNLNLLYRHLDQEGMGMRGDGMAQYTWDKRFRVSALMKGLVPSSASWQSGYKEYEAPELHLGAAARFPLPYFYGTLQTAWQSEGLLHKQAKSGNRINGSTAYSKPLDFLAASNVGLEFLFDFGLALRFGVSEFSRKSTASLATFGVGYNWRRILGLDYSFTPHPDLLSTHRVSLQLTPAFPKFKGRNYRSKDAHGAVPGSRRHPPGSEPDSPRTDPSAPSEELHNEESEPPESMVPQSLPDEAATGQSVKPATTGNPNLETQRPVETAKPAAQPTPPKNGVNPPPPSSGNGEKEVLEDEDEGQ
jgi:hypothetical protein